MADAAGYVELADRPVCVRAMMLRGLRILRAPLLSGGPDTDA
jgi:hypothetical protein